MKRTIINGLVAGFAAGSLVACGGSGSTDSSSGGKMLATTAACYPAWNSTTAYNGGAQVSYASVNYVANWWTQGQNPSTNNGGAGSGQPWTSQGACGSTPTPTPTPAPTPTPTPTPAPTPTPTPAPTPTPTPAPTPTPTPTTATPAKGWALCANENQTCNFSGTLMVRYGTGSSYVWKTATNTIACNNATFGDPASGSAKHCDIALPTQAYESVAESMQTAAYNTYHSSYVTSGRVYGYWVQANGLESLTDAYIRTRSATYKQRMIDMLNGIYANNGNSYLADFYDDEGWLAIASLRAYENTGDATYLNAVNTIWADMKTGQHPERNGILQWKKGSPGSFNAIQNNLAMIFTARLYRVTGDATLLQTSKNIHDWLKANLVDPNTGAVWDGYDATTNTTNKDWIFSYNIGTYIGGCLELYKITGDVSYYNDAVKSAEYAMTNRLTNGVFFTNENGQGDGGMFKGVFVRYLTLFAREGGLPAATKTRYENAIRSSLMAMYNQGMVQSTNLVGPVWTTKPTSTPDFSTEMSGVFLAEAATTLDRVFFYKDLNYAGYQSAFTPGSYTLSQMIAKGVLNDDITSLTIPAGVTVTVYQDDNFAGTSAVFTSSTGWLNTWNDKISSLKIK